jgi:hypothetical protein
MWKPNRRQQLALISPQYKNIKDPALRKMEMVGPPGSDSTKWEHQASSILSIDMEDGGPIWHFQATCRYFNDGDLIPVEKWPEGMDEFYGKRVRHLIPDFEKAYKESIAKIDKTKYVMHARLWMTEVQRAYLPDGAVIQTFMEQ